MAKAITHFTIYFRSKNLAHFTKVNSLNIVNNILPQHNQKPYFANFPANMYFWLFSEKTFTLCHFQTSKNSILEALAKKCLDVPVYLRKEILFWRRRKLSFGGGLNNFLKTAHCLDFGKCFKVFRFNWILWKFNYFYATLILLHC